MFRQDLKIQSSGMRSSSDKPMGNLNIGSNLTFYSKNVNHSAAKTGPSHSQE